MNNENQNNIKKLSTDELDMDFKVSNLSFEELVLGTYPDLTPKQLYVYKTIVETTWSV